MESGHRGEMAASQERVRQLEADKELYTHGGAQAIVTPSGVTSANQTRTLSAVRQRLDFLHMIGAYDVARQVLDTLAKTTEEPEELSLDDDTLDPIAVDEEDDEAQEDQMMEGQFDASDSDICLTADY